MIQFPKEPKKKKTGRNDPCHCGSGKKYKVCCQKTEQFANAPVDLTTMLKLLYCLVRGLKGENLIITKRTLDSLPADWQDKFHIQTGMTGDNECYILTAEKEKKSIIELPPEQKLIL